MNITIRVENHQPVPLRPLNEVLEELPDGKGIIYIKEEKFEAWYRLGYMFAVPLQYHDAFQADDFEAAALARLLQPGEKIIIEVTA